jgi:hypothetical protein
MPSIVGKLIGPCGSQFDPRKVDSFNFHGRKDARYTIDNGIISCELQKGSDRTVGGIQR